MNNSETYSKRPELNSEQYKKMIDQSSWIKDAVFDVPEVLGGVMSEGLVNQGKISESGRTLAQYIIENETPEILDLMFNTDDKNPLSAKERSALTHQYIKTISTTVFHARSSFSEGEIDALARSLRTRNLIRINKLQHVEGADGRKKFAQADWLPQYEERKDLVRYKALFSKVRNVFVGADDSAIVQSSALALVDSKGARTDRESVYSGLAEYTDDGDLIVRGSVKEAVTIPRPNYELHAQRFLDKPAGAFRRFLWNSRRKIAVASTLVILGCVGSGMAAVVDSEAFKAVVSIFGSVEKAQAGEVSQEQLDELYQQLTATPPAESESTSEPLLVASDQSSDEILIGEPSGSGKNLEDSPPEPDKEHEQFTDTFSYLRDTMLTNLNAMEATILAKGELTDQDKALLAGIQESRDRLINNDEIIINLTVTDRSSYAPGDTVRGYFSQGQEHIGNSDAIVQLVINKQGFHIISFGRDLQLPHAVAHSNGTFTIDGYGPAFGLGGPIKTTEDEYIIGRDGVVQTNLSNGRQDAIFDAVTGQDALFNLSLSLGRLEQLMNAFFPNGVEIHFPNGFNGRYTPHEPGDRVVLTGQEFLNHAQQRPEGSNHRFLSFFKALLIDPSNFTRIVEALDTTGPLSILAGEDLGDADGRTQTIGTTPAELAAWQAFRTAAQDKQFATDLNRLIVGDLLAQLGRLPVFGTDDFFNPIEAPNGDFPTFNEDYRDQVEDGMDAISTPLDQVLTSSDDK